MAKEEVDKLTADVAADREMKVRVERRTRKPGLRYGERADECLLPRRKRPGELTAYTRQSCHVQQSGSE